MEPPIETTAQQARGPTCGTCRARKVRCDRRKPNCTPCRKGCLVCVYAPRAGSARSRLYYDRELKKSQMQAPSATEVDYLLAGIPGSIDTERPDVLDEPRQNSPPSVPESVDRVSNGLIVYFQGGSSKFYSDVSLIGQIVEVEQYLRSQDNDGASSSSKDFNTSTLEALRDALFRNSLQDPCQASAIQRHPSQPEVEQAISIFFRHDCVQWPLYAEDIFRSNLDPFYQTPDPDKCLAYTIGAWYIVCESLRLRLSECQPQDPALATLKKSLKESTNALYAACMGFLSTPAIIKPCILDVQALTVTVTLHHGRNADFRRALEIACLLAKNIGLHQTVRQTATPDRLQEDLWIFWGLYVLDKMSLIGGGDSCLLPSPNCGVPFPGEPPTTSSEVHNLRMARIQLAGIHEQIYTSLYSVEASRRGMQQRQEAIASIAADLQQWASSYLSSKIPPQSPGRPAIFFELYSGTKYLYENSLCLVWNVSNSPDDGRKLIETARRGSNLVAKSLDAMHSHHADREAREILGLMNAYAAAPILALFRFAMCSANPGTVSDDAGLLRQILSGIASYVECTDNIDQTSDLAQTAKALNKELERKTAIVEEASRSSGSSADALWVSSSLAHIMGTSRPLNHPSHLSVGPPMLTDMCLISNSVPPPPASSAVTASEPPFANITVLPTSAEDIDSLSRQSSIYGGSAMLLSPVSMTAPDMSRVTSGHPMYPGFENALGDPYMTGVDLMAPAQHVIPDWGSFQLD